MANNKAFKVKNGLELGAISDTITDTAVDVFVYDTAKDSDGGAWRHRTQATSWYNETLNTATRGSRKEFPSVAVIVAESNQLTIYDGDDPDMPMWMVFNAQATGDMLTGGTGTLGSVAAKDGIIVVGQPTSGSTGAGGVKGIEYIADRAWQRTNKSTGSQIGYFKGNISQREDALAYDSTLGTDGRIVNILVNDVAITTLPNAPIDAATGLPVPTIAVATDGGWSQISDDGNVYDFVFSTNPKVTNIAFKNDTIIQWSGDSNLFTYDRGYFEAPLLTSDLTAQSVTTFNGSASYEYGSTTETRYPNPIAGSTDTTNFSIPNAFGNINGLSLYDGLFENKVTSSGSNGMVAYTASDYATGWMNGAIKLATLSDTDDTNVTGSELVTNGTFDSNINDWQARGNASNSWNSSGYIDIDRNGETLDAGRNVAYQVISGFTVGATYTASAEVIALSNGFTLTASLSTLGSNIVKESAEINAVGIATVTFVATATTLALGLGARGNQNATATVDNVTLRLAEEDRSVNGNDLQVFGTVTKSAVNTGADLVAYSGFSVSNYLLQPYNSDLDFGTGDFTYAVWFYIDSDTTHGNFIFSRRQDSGGNGFALYVGGGGDHTIRFQTSDGTATTTASTQTINVGQWNLIVASRINSTTIQFSVNGQEPEYVETASRNVNVTSGTPLHVGINYNLSSSSNVEGSIALARISATVPSPEQIKKIYEDEKFLFQENAQATLYGSSDAVTALAYDDTTELLHAGTSAGRSVFQGLRRVNNTTTAVSAAISASNNLVGEQ